MYMILWKVESIKKEDKSLRTDVYNAGVLKEYNDAVNLCLEFANKNAKSYNRNIIATPVFPVSDYFRSCSFSVGFEVKDFEEYDFIKHRYEIISLIGKADGYTGRWPWALIGTFEGKEIPHKWNDVFKKEKIEEKKKDNMQYRPHVIIKGFSSTINKLRSTIEKSLKKNFSPNAYLAHYGVRYKISYIYDRRLSDEYAYDAVLDVIPEKDLDSNNDAIAFIRTVLLSLMDTDDSWFWLSFISRLIDKLKENKNGVVSYEGFPINISSIIYYGNPLIDNQDLSDFKTL